MAFFGWFTKKKSAAYEGAAGSRRLRNWYPTSASINTALRGEGSTLRARSRDIARQNAYAANGIEALVANLVGTGLKPQSKIADADLRKQVQALWLDWTDEADADGLTDLYGLQALIARAVIEGGECLVRFRPRRVEDGLTVPLQLQVLEAEHLATIGQTVGNNTFDSGIEFSPIGQRLAYHLYRKHPGDQSGTVDVVRVPASEILHIYKPLRPGQIRGEPWLARTLVKLKELDSYDDAELLRKKMAAMFAAFITRNDPDGVLMGEGDPDDKGVADVALEPGTMQVLEPGEDIKFADPADVGGSYEAFVRQQLRSVAVALGVTYEQLSGDLTGVNYSSIRAGLLEFRRRIEMVQHQMMVFQFCRPVWQRWMEAAALSGALPGQPWVKSRRAMLACKWIAQGWDWVDPLKDQQAEQMAVRNGFKSRSEVVSSMGYDAEEVDAELAADNARADSLGLKLDSDPRHVAKTGVLQQEKAD